jgi:hypothetical protein
VVAAVEVSTAVVAAVSTVVVVATAAASMVGLPMVALAAAHTGVPAATEAWADTRRHAVSAQAGLGPRKAAAFVTHRPDGIRLEDPETARACLHLVAACLPRAVPAWLRRTAQVLLTGIGTPSEAPTMPSDRRPGQSTTLPTGEPVAWHGTAAGTAEAGAAVGAGVVVGDGAVAGDAAGGLAGASVGVLSGLGHRTITAHGGTIMPTLVTSTNSQVDSE